MKMLKMYLFLCFFTGSLWANDDHALLVNQLKYQTGEIKLADNIATIKLKENYKFLDQKQAKVVLEKIWGNPESENLGLLVPSDFDPLSDQTWAIEIYFLDDGYINDEDAEKIDYSKLLKDMQKEAIDSNKDRKKEGYSTFELIGWATPPKYDKESHKMYWAKEIRFEGDEVNTLNYNIRFLGRKGVLVFNAIAGMNSLKIIEQKTPEIFSMVDFTPGNKYSDFNKSTDKIAEYGIAALVAGGLAKIGFFKGIWIALIAFKKFIVYGLIAVGGGIFSFFKRKKKSSNG